MSFPVEVEDFKTYFDRDFSYGTGMETVRDSDISKAFLQAAALFNSSLWANDDEKKMAFLWASAHLVCIDTQAAGGLTTKPGKGISNHGGGITAAKGVGQVNVQYAISQSLLESPILNQFMRTDYGQKYLQLVSSRIVGHVHIVPGFNDTRTPRGQL